MLKLLEGSTIINPIFLVVLIIICVLFDSSLAAIIGCTIGVGDELNSTNMLVSKNGHFTLGFFTITQTSYTYLGIWNREDYFHPSTKVWVANPNAPIFNNPGVLTVDATGKLKITAGHGGTTIFNISSDHETENATATLQNSGNFVLTDEIQKQILWQSFDYPSNTYMPGMKLGLNSAIGQNWHLTSWVSDSFPASGAFTLSWEPTTTTTTTTTTTSCGSGRGQVVISRRGKPYRSMLIDDLMLSYNDYNLCYVSNNDEKYIISYYYNISYPLWVLSPNGEILREPFSDDGVKFCYGYEKHGDESGGCVLNSEMPNCRTSNNVFVEKRIDVSTDSWTCDYNSSLKSE